MTADDPIHLELDTIAADEGWRWRLRVWIGPVDVRNTPPTRILEAPTAFLSKRMCYLAGLARARVIAL